MHNMALRFGAAGPQQGIGLTEPEAQLRDRAVGTSPQDYARGGARADARAASRGAGPELALRLAARNRRNTGSERAKPIVSRLGAEV